MSTYLENKIKKLEQDFQSKSIKRCSEIPDTCIGRLVLVGSNLYVWEDTKYVKFSKGGGELEVVNNYSALPDPTTVSGSFYWTSNSQGTKWLPGSLGGTYYPKGIYYSNGADWEFIETPYQSTQSEVNVGTNTDTFVTPKTLKDSSQWNTKFDIPAGNSTHYLDGAGALAIFPVTYTKSETDDLLDSKRNLYTWEYLVLNWSSNPTINTAIIGGDVYDYTLNGTTRYRFVPTTYDSTENAFYSNFDGVNLTDIITTRG